LRGVGLHKKMDVGKLNMLFQGAMLETSDDPVEVVKRITKVKNDLLLEVLKKLNSDGIVDGKKIGLGHAIGEFMKEVYRISLRHSQLDRETFKSIVELKYKLTKMMECLDDKNVHYHSDAKKEVTDGVQLKLYDTVFTLVKNIDNLLYMSALIELVSTTKNRDKIINHLEKYIEDVMYKATILVSQRVAKEYKDAKNYK